MRPAYSDREKLRAVEREVALRKIVYAKRVQREQMTAEEATRETEIMQAIAEDYRQRIEHNEGLFPRA